MISIFLWKKVLGNLLHLMMKLKTFFTYTQERIIKI